METHYMIAVLQIISMFAIAIGGLEFTAFGAHLNSERVVSAVIVFGLLLYVISNRIIYWSFPAWMYLAWAMIVVLSFILSDNPSAHLNGLLITLVPFVFFVLFQQAGLTARQIIVVAETFLWTAALTGITVFIVWSTTGALEPLMDRGRIMLLVSEPNIFGAYLAIFMVIHMSVSRIRPRVVILHLVSAVALILTASKGPYIFYLVGLLFTLLKKGVLLRPGPFVAMLLGLVGASILGILMADRIGEFYQAALDRPDAINNRLRLLEVAWSRIGASPLLGHGPLDFALVSPDLLMRMGTTNVQNLWIWQIWVAILHDQGAIGLVTFVFLLVGSWRRCSKQARQGSTIHIGYLAAILVIVGVSQTTTLHLSAIFGMILGLANGRAPAAELVEERFQPAPRKMNQTYR